MKHFCHCAISGTFFTVYSTNRGQSLHLRDVKHCYYFLSQRHNANTEQGIPVWMQTNVRVWSIKVLHRRFIPLFGNGFRWGSQALRHSLHSLDKQMISMTTMDNLGKSDGPAPFIWHWLRFDGSAVCSIWDVSYSVGFQQLPVTRWQTSTHKKNKYLNNDLQ